MRWIPLEANPDVMNKYIKSMGVKNGWEFVDVWGLDSELLAFIPRPVAAVLVLYPLTPNVDSQPIGEVKLDSDMVFMKQTIGNSCGTMAIIHSLANTIPLLKLEDKSYIKNLIDRLKATDVDDRFALLETDKELCSLHDENANTGQTEAPSAETNTNLHFVTFVEHNDHVYELDGRRPGPVDHGKCVKRDLLEDTVEVIKRFMTRDPSEVHFSVIALAKLD